VFTVSLASTVVELELRPLKNGIKSFKQFLIYCQNFVGVISLVLVSKTAIDIDKTTSIRPWGDNQLTE